MSVLFCGDICPTLDTTPLFETKDCLTVFGNVTPLLKSANMTIANLECALTGAEATPIEKIGPNLKAPASTAAALRDAGIDLCTLANNHIFDYGEKGLSDTLSALEKAGISYTGIGKNEADARKPFYFEDHGVRVGIIAVGEHEYSYALPDACGIWSFDPLETLFDVEEAKHRCDRLVVLYHGGKEQCEYPSPRLKKTCRAIARAGADVVLCQHSHCIGACEEYGESYILYGQGNFHFVKPHHQNPQWFSGLLLEIDFQEHMHITYHPTMVKENGIALAQGDEKERILEAFSERNAVFCDEERAHAEWHRFCLSQEPVYRRVIREALQSDDEGENINEMFPHYLDCEAHTDVWRELFKTLHAQGKNHG